MTSDLFFFPQARVPNLDSPSALVTAARCQIAPVGAEGHAPEFASEDLEPDEFLTRGRVPEPHRVAFTGRGQPPAVGAEDDAKGTLGKRDRAKRLAGRHVPEHELVLAR